MKDTLLSDGKCIYCREVIQNSIVKHLAKRLSGFEKEKTSESEEVYHLNINFDVKTMSNFSDILILKFLWRKPLMSLSPELAKTFQQHEEECDYFLDYAKMPVINSPRMGICGYSGGSIDIERDGIYFGKS
ncbi:MAG: hypothetical protein ACOYXT_26005 [Bacteroidota bacterium]